MIQDFATLYRKKYSALTCKEGNLVTIYLISIGQKFALDAQSAVVCDANSRSIHASDRKRLMTFA